MAALDFSLQPDEIYVGDITYLPASYFNLAEEEKQKAELTQDICVTNDERVDGKDDSFSWNVWAEITREDFEDEQENWNEENRFLRKPYSGILDTSLNSYANTLGLKVSTQTQKTGFIPDISIDSANHPLYLEQESGIDMKRVTMFALKTLHATRVKSTAGNNVYMLWRCNGN